MNKKKAAGIVALVVLIAVMAVLYVTLKEKPVAGSKTITIEVVNSQGDSTMYEVQTDAEFLAQAMDEAEGLEYEAEDSTYGLVVNEVNGESAVLGVDGHYWGFFVNGEYCNYGISEQPVEDGDDFQIVYSSME